MGDWITRIVAALALLGTGFLAGSLFVATRYSEQIGFPYTTTERLQWEVLATGIAAIAGGVLAYLGATKPHKLTIQQQFIAYRLNVRTATNRILFLKDDSGIKLAVFTAIAVRKFEKKSESITSEIIKDAAKKVVENLHAPPPEIISDELEGLVYDVKIAASGLVREASFDGLKFKEAISYIEELLSYLDERC